MNLDISLENVQRRIGMSMDYYEDDLYTGEDYDDGVFATLNS